MLSSDAARVYPSPFRSTLFWVAIGLCAFLYAPSLFWSLGLDQNIFAEIGSLILKGQKPYVDAWDVKPPNIFYTYALFEWLFGQNELAVRISDYIFTLFACIAIYVGVDRRLHMRRVSDWMRHWAPPIAALLMALTLLSLGLSDTAQTESYALGFILLAAYFAVGGSGVRVCVAGALIGIATFYKTTNAVFLVPLIIEISLVRISKGARVRSIGLLLLGFFAWCGLEIAILAAAGILRGYLAIATSVIQHHSHEPGDVSFASLVRALWVSVDFWNILALIAIAWAMIRGDRTILKILRLPLMYLAVGLFAVYVQHKGWGYHYVITHPGLISTCAISATYLLDRLRARSGHSAMFALVLLAILALIATPSARRRMRYASAALPDRSNYISSLGAKRSLYYPAGTDSLAEYLKRTTSPDESVFIFGEEPGAFWRADRQPASRYIYALLFTSGVVSADELQSIGDTLASKRPGVIVVERFDTTAFRGRPETSESLVGSDSNFASLRNLLERDYDVRDTVCDKFIVYCRKQY